MTARDRVNETVTVDDAIYSCEIVDAFMKHLKEVDKVAVAGLQYQDYYDAQYKHFSSNASVDMQMLNYQDRHQASCAYGYVKVRQVAEQEKVSEEEISNRVRQVKKMFKVPNLERRRNLADLEEEFLEMDDYDEGLRTHTETEEVGIDREVAVGVGAELEVVDENPKRRQSRVTKVKASPIKRARVSPALEEVPKDSGNDEPVQRIVIDDVDDSNDEDDTMLALLAKRFGSDFPSMQLQYLNNVPYIDVDGLTPLNTLTSHGYKREMPTINGRGVYAKVNIAKWLLPIIVASYRGKNEEVTKPYLNKLNKEQRDRVATYWTGMVEADCKYIVLAHCESYL
ncbi:unnamed protein product [Cylicocyclus nassatus]|uniref:Uncharacterized protein n=1 Tax=Cylicocyclus nassatus TaxID=53992 RepID=A0AA36GM07_CYLNA|nr:unnamed protein product [Cylicocyclus nassatus]